MNSPAAISKKHLRDAELVEPSPAFDSLLAPRDEVIIVCSYVVA